MNERSLEILKLLIRNPDFKLVDLENHLNLTKRQLNYGIKLMNESLVEQKLPIIKRSQTGKFNVPSDLTQAFAEFTQEKIFQSESNQTIYSEYERAYLIVVYLFIKKDIASLAHITDLLDVSKNTALEDLKNAKEVVGKYQLTLRYSRKEGYFIFGDELNCRLLMNELIQKKRMFADLNNPLGKEIDCKRDEVIHFIRTIEKQLGIIYADESFAKMTELIYYTVGRIQNQSLTQTLFFHDQVKETREYEIVKKLVNPKWVSVPDDYEWLTLLLLSSNIYQNNTDEEQGNHMLLQNHTKQMIQLFQRQTLIEIDDRANFEKRLLAHLKPAWFRIKYGLKLGDFGSKELIKDHNHGILMDLMKEMVVPIEKEIGKKFPQEELELLSFYFGHQLSKKNEPNIPKKKAVVVCTNGMIVSKMMRENLKKLFPEFNFMATFSVREFQDFQTDYELVFTTVPLKTTLPQYIIEPIMAYKEQINLRYRVLKEMGLTEVDDLVTQLMQLIEKNSVIKSERKLKNDLKEFFLETSHQPEISDFKVLPELSSYIAPQSIQIIEEEISWKEAVILAARPLITQKVISENYLDELIRQTAADTNASFLGEKMAIPHSEKEDGVLGEGIALLVSKKPIIFPNQQKIHFIAPIAILDYSNHLRAINQLADLALSHCQNDLLLAMNEEKDVHQLIAQLK